MKKTVFILVLLCSLAQADSPRDFLYKLFPIYFSNGNDIRMKEFFDKLRANDPEIFPMIELRKKLVEKYSFDDGPNETAALWVMQPGDARVLFLLSQTDPTVLPPAIAKATHLAIYDQLMFLFLLGSTSLDTPGILPVDEYLRLEEILNRMSGLYDPYLKALNAYYRALAFINAGLSLDARPYIERSRTQLHELLLKTTQKLAQRRILGTLAEIEELLGNYDEAEEAYIWILKINPNDSSALIRLSYLLNREGKCEEPGIWVEAFIKSDQEYYDVVLHCGNREFKDQDLGTAPLIASIIPVQ